MQQRRPGTDAKRSPPKNANANATPAAAAPAAPARGVKKLPATAPKRLLKGTRPTSAAALAQQPPTTPPEALRNVPMTSGFKDGLDLDVAIIGAGVSGLYAAYRLTGGGAGGASMYAPGGVHVFEMGDRIGGRLLSVKLPGLEIVGELGGMRYMKSQEIVTTLIEKVFADELTSIPFPMGEPAHLFAYLRKQLLTQDAWQKAQNAHIQGTPLVTRYALNGDDVGFSSDQLFNKIAYDVLTADPWFVKNYPGAATKTDAWTYEVNLTAEQWDVIKPQLTYHREGSPYDGMKLNDLGFWNVLKDQVSQEGFEFLADAGGYYSNTINWNAAEAFPYMISDFTGGSGYSTIQGGYDLIAYALAKAYLDTPGATLWSQNQLVTFERNLGGKRRYTLIFRNVPSGRTYAVHADSIVLAMPRRSLELLDQRNFFFNPQTQTRLQTNIASVIIQPSYKILMAFDKPWWVDDFQSTSGHSITDLPMRQCYYFGTDPDDTHSLLLGSYNDMTTVPFWEVLARTPQTFQYRGTKRVSLESLHPLRSVQAPQAMVDECAAELRELHARPDIPLPYVTWFKDWSEDPFGGGYHGWRAGFDVANVMRYMRRPDPNENVHVCGEAYSDQQGWVEGAFCVTERMLQEHFALPWPIWLDRGYYLGW